MPLSKPWASLRKESGSPIGSQIARHELSSLSQYSCLLPLTARTACPILRETNFGWVSRSGLPACRQAGHIFDSASSPGLALSSRAFLFASESARGEGLTIRDLTRFSTRFSRFLTLRVAPCTTTMRDCKTCPHFCAASRLLSLVRTSPLRLPSLLRQPRLGGRWHVDLCPQFFVGLGR